MGTRLTARAMIAAAAADRACIAVARRPRAAIIATGDELAAPGEAHLAADTIPESVGFGVAAMAEQAGAQIVRSEEHTSELQSLMRISYAVFCLNKKIQQIP